MMNILYISSKKRWGGVVSWMLKTAIGLRNNGHTVWILSHPDSKLNKTVKDKSYIVEKKLGPNFNPVTIIYLIRFIKKNNIHLVVTNIDKEIGIGGIAAKLTGIPNIRRVGREDDFNHSIRTKLTHKLLVDSCIVPCNYVSGILTSTYDWLSKDIFTTIYNGRDIHETDMSKIAEKRSEWGILEDQNIIGITCQLTKVKYVEHLIEAFREIYGNFENWRLVITGDGPKLSFLKETAEKLNISDNVIFAGFTQDPIFTASCYDIALSTSKIEGFPNSIVEYFAAGRPVISTNVGGVNEIIEDGVNGFLIPFGDIGKLKERLEELMTDPEKRDKFSERTKITLKENFTEKMMIKKLDKYFSDKIGVKK